MRGKFFAALALALVSLGLLATDASAQRRDRDNNWILLGQKEVGFNVDRDAIGVGQTEEWYRARAFRTLHFYADRNDIYMLSVRVVYFNGYGEDFRVDQLIRRGDYLPLDLRGDRSFIRRVEMVYRSRPNFRGEAVISVYGELGRGGGGGGYGGGGGGGGYGGNWEELGCKEVALFGKDRDFLRVGRSEGGFKAIRLYTRGADVEILRVRVIYGNGEPDDLDVRQFLRQGDRTKPFDLQGWRRSIDRIEMIYRTIPNFKGLARVCVEGAR
jgi:hypothetical protein